MLKKNELRLQAHPQPDTYYSTERHSTKTQRKLKCRVIVFTHRFRFTRHLVSNHVGGGESEGERRRRSLVISAKCRNQRKRALMGACQRQRVPYYSRCSVQIKDMLCNKGEKKERQNGRRLIHEVGGSNPYRGSRCSPKDGMLDRTHEACGIGQADSNKTTMCRTKSHEDNSINVDT